MENTGDCLVSNRPTIIVPDIHNRTDRVSYLLNKYPDNPFIFLGDWWDNFYDVPEDAKRVALLLNQVAVRPNTVLLWGNHDLHYFLPLPGIVCSGYDLDKQDAINSHLEEEVWRKFNLAYGDEYLFSHAGFHSTYRPEAIPSLFEEIESAECWIFKAGEATKLSDELSVLPRLIRAGRDRGGQHRIGGCTWLDWDSFSDIPSCPQIVGHTPSSKVRYKGKSICLDTHLNHFGILDHNKLTVKEIP